MLRRRIKLGLLTGGLAVSALASLPTLAQNPTMAVPATNVPAPDVRARVWAATARYVYNDDPALASLRGQLLQSIDSSSVKAFGHRLENAVRLEQKKLPKQGHLLKFLELFKTASTSNEQPDQLANTITSTLLNNKPERKAQPSFAQLRTTLHTLANPTAPAAPSAPAAANTATAAAPDSTAQAVTTAPAPAAAASPVSITSTSSTPMISWIALALSIISLLVSLLKSNRSRGRHPHSSSQPLALTSLTDDMRAEIRTMLQREVGKLPGARPAPEALAAKPVAPTAQAPKAAPAKAAPAPAPAAIPAPAPTPAPAPAPVTASPTPPEPVAAPEPAASAEAEDFFTVNYPVENEPVAAAPTRMLYANQQPIDGFFKRDMLAEAPASYTIFELTTSANTPDQAQFVVTNNPSGHAGYIGSHQNILSGACEYPFPKGSVSRIVSDAPGLAQRTASGDWQITRKAQIHFE
jgi:hypothetical protein